MLSEADGILFWGGIVDNETFTLHALDYVEWGWGNE